MRRISSSRACLILRSLTFGAPPPLRPEIGSDPPQNLPDAWDASNIKSFAVFWVSDGFNLNSELILGVLGVLGTFWLTCGDFSTPTAWYIASAMLPALNWWQAWLCVWVGYTGE